MRDNCLDSGGQGCFTTAMANQTHKHGEPLKLDNGGLPSRAPVGEPKTGLAAPIPILPFLEGRRGDLILMRFWSNVAVAGPDDCWDWQMALTESGYGRFKIASYTVVRAHRFSLVAHSKSDPSHLLALHSCDRRSCCNPHHLRWGTPQDNNNDTKARGRWANGAQVGFGHIAVIRGGMKG